MLASAPSGSDRAPAVPERVPGASPTTCRPPDGTAARSVDVYVRVSRDVGVKLLFFFFVVSVHQLSFVQFCREQRTSESTRSPRTCTSSLGNATSGVQLGGHGVVRTSSQARVAHATVRITAAAVAIHRATAASVSAP